jgi:FtsH-binding integral membrane protein
MMQLRGGIMQASTYVGDPLRQEAHSARPLVLGVLAGLVLLLAGLRILPEESTPLMAKVMGLLSATISTAAVGAYLGRRLNGWLAMLGLLALSILGMFIIKSLGGGDLAIVLLLGWGVVNGMMLGPLVHFAIAEGGSQMVIQALAGTTAVMLLAALVAFVTGINVSFLAPILLIALIGLIVVGLIGIFVRFSRGVNLVYSVIGMIVFAGFFLLSFARMNKSENTWRAAVDLTISLYLNFANFFALLLRFLLVSKRR